MVNINNISNKKEFKKKNQKEDSKFENNLKIIPYYSDEKVAYVKL